MSNKVITQAESRTLPVRYGWGTSPFGAVLVAYSEWGVCHVSLADHADASHEATLRAAWPQATRAGQDHDAQNRVTRMFQPGALNHQVPLVLRGTAFQRNIWNALREVPFGDRLSYQALARQAGYPNAQRAVGQALAANSIAILIPCHRVVPASGQTGAYRWGTPRKQALLDWESQALVHVSHPSPD